MITAPCKDITKECYGGKAFWLNWLISNGYNVPPTFFVKAKSDTNVIQIDFNDQIEINWLFAVRSSSTVEDDNETSNAGVYESYLNVPFDDIENKANAVIRDGLSKSPEPIGVIVQKMVKSVHSGVIFSSNPVTASKKEITLSWIDGLGDRLVSGESDSNDCIIKISDDGNYIHEKTTLDEAVLEQLCSISKKIEKELSFPVDIEWAVTENNELFILQCRPITNVFMKKEGISEISKEDINGIEQRFLNSDKIDLRLMSESKGLMISKGYLLTMNCTHDSALDITSEIHRSELCHGYSVVILYPKKISNRVVRSFVGDGKNFEKYVACHRFTIRSYPDYDSLQKCVDEMYRIAKNESWVCSMIIQEIIQPIFTGMLKKNGDDMIIDIARGQFLSKGMIDTSNYIIRNGSVINRNEIIQPNYLLIIEGSTIEFNNGDEPVILPDEDIQSLIDSFRTLVEDERIVVEFGITEHEGKHLCYLIDCMRSDNIDTINSEQLMKGVISEGKIKGKLVKLEPSNPKSAINKHFYDGLNDNDSSEPMIYYSDLPSIEYLHLLRPNTGFVFKSGSVLCHLSVLLREKRIPAVTGIDLTDAKNGLYFLDTNAGEKIRKIE